MASWPLPASTSTLGMNVGATRSGPRARRTSVCSAMPITPPMAEPRRMPTRAGSYAPSRPASATASRAAASASRTLRSSFRTSFGEATALGSKSFTSAAMRTGNPLASNERMKSTPLSPATAARHVERASFPIGVTAPSPVTTTLRISGRLRSRARRAARRCTACAGRGQSPRRGLTRSRRSWPARAPRRPRP